MFDAVDTNRVTAKIALQWAAFRRLNMNLNRRLEGQDTARYPGPVRKITAAAALPIDSGDPAHSRTAG